MARKSYQELEAIKQQYGVDRIWSFSRINSFINCPQSYFLKYVKKEKEKESSIYALLGSEFHDILEKYYNNELKREELPDEAKSAILNIELLDLKFNRNDDAQNENIKQKYFACINDFFLNHKTVPYNIKSEQYLLIKIGNHLLNGYLDAVHKENDTYIVTDYKSSSIYTGKKIPQEGRQLMLYSLGLHQTGIPVEQIKCRWNFLKYNSVTFMQKNGKEKTMNCERHAWVGKLKSKLRGDLKDLNYDAEEIENLLEQCMLVNSIDILPDKVKNKYNVSDCYVYVPLDKEILLNLERELTETIELIIEREGIYGKTKDINIWNKSVEDKDFYWCSNICGYTPNQCFCYKEFLDNKDMFKTSSRDEEDDDSESWLKELGLI